MKVSKSLLSTVAFASVASFAIANGCGPVDSYNDYLRIKGQVVAFDGVTPVIGLDFDQLVATFVVDDGAEIVRTITFSDQLGYVGNFWTANGVSDTDSDGQLLAPGGFDLLRKGIDLDRVSSVPDYESVCVRYDRDGWCTRWTDVYVGEKLIAITYALTDIETSKTALSFRYNHAIITIPGQKISHGRAPQINEGNNTYRRAWVMEDRYLSPFSAAEATTPEAAVGSVEKSGVKTIAKAEFVRYEDLEASDKAVADKAAVSVTKFYKRLGAKKAAEAAAESN